jgi:hypothetical protein
LGTQVLTAIQLLPLKYELESTSKSWTWTFVLPCAVPESVVRADGL